MPRKATTSSLADKDPAPGGAAAVDRALTLLMAFCDNGLSLSLSELSAKTGLYKSTALRLLASLEHAGMLCRRENGNYALGSGVARLSAAYTASFSLESVVLPALRGLVSVTGESAAFHVRQGAVRVCLYRVDSPHPVRDHIQPGEILPMHRGTGGHVLAAFGGVPEENRKAHAGLDALYEKVRQQGYCAMVGDRVDGVAGISAPVFRTDGKLLGALTLTMPKSRYRKQWVNSVVQSAKELSNRA